MCHHPLGTNNTSPGPHTPSRTVGTPSPGTPPAPEITLGRFALGRASPHRRARPPPPPPPPPPPLPPRARGGKSSCTTRPARRAARPRLRPRWDGPGWNPVRVEQDPFFRAANDGVPRGRRVRVFVKARPATRGAGDEPTIIRPRGFAQQSEQIVAEVHGRFVRLAQVRRFVDEVFVKEVEFGVVVGAVATSPKVGETHLVPAHGESRRAVRLRHALAAPSAVHRGPPRTRAG